MIDYEELILDIAEDDGGVADDCATCNPMVGTYWCDDCGWEDKINKYDELTTEAKVRCMSEYIFSVCPYESCDEMTIAELEDNIRIALEESERNGLEINDDGIWWLYGERC